MFGKIFRGLKKVAAVTVKTALPVVIAAVEPTAIINTVVGGVLKHKTPLDNNKIPYLNLFVSTGVAYVKNVFTTGDWAASLGPALQEGGALMGISTALHQSLKLPIKKTTGHSI